MTRFGKNLCKQSIQCHSEMCHFNHISCMLRKQMFGKVMAANSVDYKWPLGYKLLTSIL